MFKEAKKHCDYLVVVVARDEWIYKKGRIPIHNQEERANILRAIKYIDEVAIGSKNREETLKKINPDIIFYGYDQKPIFKPHGIKIIKLKKYGNFKTSKIVGDKMEVVKLKQLKDTNIIIGQSHFIKTVEDIYEALAESVPGIKFGIAFCEASGPRLIRYDGNDEELIKNAIENAKMIGAGHSFIIVIKNAFPINIIPKLKTISEIVNIYCATANPVEVLVYETSLGRGIMGVIDGGKPLGVEGEKEKQERLELLKKINYKR